MKDKKVIVKTEDKTEEIIYFCDGCEIEMIESMYIALNGLCDTCACEEFEREYYNKEKRVHAKKADDLNIILRIKQEVSAELGMTIESLNRIMGTDDRCL